MQSTDKLVSYFFTNYKNIWDSLENCYHSNNNQPNPFHLEDSTLTHTLLSLQVARRRYPDNFFNKLAVLCHDFGKPLSREISDKGRVRFFGHESLSNFVACDFLNDPFLNLHHDEKVTIHEIINYHLKVWDLLKFDNDKEPKKRASGNLTGLSNRGKEIFGQIPCTFEDLITLLECDEQGRICTDQKDLDFYTKLKKISSELYPPVRNIYQDKNKITLLIGPPLSGKSTWVKKNHQDEVIISRDEELMTFAQAEYDKNNPNKPWQLSYTEAFKQYGQDPNIDKNIKELYNKSIKDNKDIIIDMTNMSAKSRKKWLQVPHTYEKRAIVFMVDIEVLKERNIQRSKEGKTIPSEVLINMMKNFTVPTPDQFNKIDWIF